MKPQSHLFSVSVAQVLGVPCAIVFEYFARQIHANKSNANEDWHYRDDHWWTYNSAEALTKIFPYWNARQIRHTLKKLVDAGVIIKSQQAGYDRRNWYALGPKTPLDINVECIGHKCQIDSTCLADPSDKKGKCIEGAVDKPVGLPVKGKSSQTGLSARGQDKATQRADCGLLIREGVDRQVAEAIVYEQRTRSKDIRQAVQNALAKEWEAKKGGGTWMREPGYIVETINAAFREEHMVRPSPAFRRMEKALKPETVSPRRALPPREFEAKKQRDIAALVAAST